MLTITFQSCTLKVSEVLQRAGGRAVKRSALPLLKVTEQLASFPKQRCKSL